MDHKYNKNHVRNEFHNKQKKIDIKFFNYPIIQLTHFLHDFYPVY